MVVDFESVVGNVILGEVISSVCVLDDSKIIVVVVVLVVGDVEFVFEVEVTVANSVEVCPISVIEDGVVVVRGICAVVMWLSVSNSEEAVVNFKSDDDIVVLNSIGFSRKS